MYQAYGESLRIKLEADRRKLRSKCEHKKTATATIAQDTITETAGIAVTTKIGSVEEAKTVLVETATTASEEKDARTVTNLTTILIPTITNLTTISSKRHPEDEQDDNVDKKRDTVTKERDIDLSKTRKKKKTTKDRKRCRFGRKLTDLQQKMIQQYEEQRRSERFKDRNRKVVRKQQISWDDEVDFRHRDKHKNMKLQVQ